ncbi:tRNA (adenosine(37)-N6)-threonylcarbamoyltransferase complex ATPase subunit type 1 TsaE [Salipaludibacillus daqingensis]|uniref:tRNA (adenosine(37)-N6)-threonylcarbamoyltransferase complex ATPase subunit type 1 TsaE n=1 Tax=Salipaludibacillus daqingensis TaxID=3041001 RepID=UPI002476BF1E|nr:tRNA (adenosine(37)-N6)-threonylcarbamoyltransferase complex ATPase subunit type 1 TsaE [Salipaludibacillus daqingensis]
MKEEWTIKSVSPKKTAEIADKLGKLVKPNDIITLKGDLGAGKTTFTKSLAKALGVERTVNSPTFTIMKEYQGYLPFYHMDAYRIADELEDLGLDEYFESGGVTVIEWPEMIAEQLPEERLDIVIEYTGEDERLFYFIPTGDYYVTLIKEFMDYEHISN